MQPGVVPEADVLYGKMVEHGKLMLKNSEYLSLVDLLLLAQSVDKEPMIVFLDSDRGNPPRLQSLETVVERFCSQEAVNDKEPDLACPNTWYYVSCCADFQRRPTQQLNHYIPAWHRTQFASDSEWDVARLSLLDDLQSKHLDVTHSLHIEMEKEEMDAESDSDVALVETRLGGLLDEEKCLADTIKAVEFLLSLDLYPYLVPCDGNCGIWSTLMLQNGLPTSLDALNAPRQMGEMMELREELCDLWAQAALKDTWRMAFRHCVMNWLNQQRDLTPPRRPSKRCPEFSPDKHVDEKRHRCRPAEFGKAPEKQYLAARAKAPVMLQGQEDQEPDRQQGDPQPQEPAVDEFFEIVQDQPDATQERLLDPTRIRRAQHTRDVRKKPPNESTIKSKVCKHYLTHRGLTYGIFQSQHARRQGKPYKMPWSRNDL